MIMATLTVILGVAQLPQENTGVFATMPCCSPMHKRNLRGMGGGEMPPPPIFVQPRNRAVESVHKLPTPIPTPQLLKLRLLHKSSICINNGKPMRRFITTT
jgi:hypothetical protein